MTYDAHSYAGKESNLIDSLFLQKDSILQIWLIGYPCFRKNINERNVQDLHELSLTAHLITEHASESRSWSATESL